MEQVIDKIISELTTFAATAEVDGGISEILDIQAVYFGDPGIVPVQLYPMMTVQPIRDAPKVETTGYDVRNLQVLITLSIDSREYFDKDTDEATGDRKLTQSAMAMSRWLRRVANRRLDGEAGQVREVTVDATNYLVEIRGSVITKAAQLTLTVNKQYPREE